MSRKIIIVLAILVFGAAEFGFGAWMYQTAAVDKMREAAVEQLYAMVDLEDYGPAQQKKIKRIQEYNEGILMKAEDQKDVDQTLAECSARIGKIQTLSELRKKGISRLKKLVSLKDYREEQQKEIKKILKKNKKKIKKCETKKQVNKIIKKAKAQLGDIKTDAQLTAEEEAARQAELARQRAAAAAAAKRSAKKSSKKKKSSGGCVGNDAKNFY